MLRQLQFVLYFISSNHRPAEHHGGATEDDGERGEEDRG